MHLRGVTKVYDPGCHCAFTDVYRWRDRVYLAFREAMNHSVRPSGQIVVLASADKGCSFGPHARLALAGHDLRDPHIFEIGERLFLTVPTWRLPRERVSLVASSEDGLRWELHSNALFEGLTLWRPRRGPDGAIYAAAYAHEEPHGQMVHLMRTTDGIEWEKVSVISEDGRPNETELCFLEDGELLALVRREEPPNHPQLARARPPYTEWLRIDCDRYLQGPMLERMPDGRLLAVGRSQVSEGEKDGPRVTRGFDLDIETGSLTQLFELPSGNDTSYAGLSWVSGDEALLSYYSGHEYSNGAYRGGDEVQRTAIYVARLGV